MIQRIRAGKFPHLEVSIGDKILVKAVANSRLCFFIVSICICSVLAICILQVDPFPAYNDFFSGDVQIHPVLSLPEPKRRFVRSKWEEKK